MTAAGESHDWLRTALSGSTADSITVRGRDLARELMGKVSFSELTFLLVSGRMPSSGELHLFDAILVSLAEHGLTPTSLVARLTHTGAPESAQGAIAAGLLGGGSVFLGPVEDTARFLGSIVEQIPPGDLEDEATLESAAGQRVHVAVEAKQKIPGLGHPVHKELDPRVPRLYDIARTEGLAGSHLRLLQFVAAAYRAETGSTLAINGAGAAGAALADLGFTPFVARGFALLARAAGLVAHLAEEAARPIGMRLWKEVDDRASGAQDAQADLDG